MRIFSIVTAAIIAVGACGCSWSFLTERQIRQARERNEERRRRYERMYGTTPGPQTAEQLAQTRKLHSLMRDGRWEDIEALLSRQEPSPGQR